MKKLLCISTLCLVLAVMLSALPVALAKEKGYDAELNVTPITGVDGQTYYDLAINITENDGIVALPIMITFDSESVEVVGISFENSILDQTETSYVDEFPAKSPYNILYLNYFNVYETGNVCVVRFRLLENKHPNYRVSVNFSINHNEDVSDGEINYSFEGSPVAIMEVNGRFEPVDLPSDTFPTLRVKLADNFDISWIAPTCAGVVVVVGVVVAVLKRGKILSFIAKK